MKTRPVLWVGKRPEDMLTYPTKKASKPEPIWERAVWVQLPYERVWIKLDVNGKALTKRGPVEVIQAYLNGVGPVIGLPNLDAADHGPFCHEWRGMVAGRKIEEAKQLLGIGR